MKFKAGKSVQRAIASLLVVWSFLPVSMVKAVQKKPVMLPFAAKQRLNKQKGKTGKFKVIYQPVTNPDYKELQQELAKSKAFDSLAGIFNEILILPTDVQVNIAECGEINAYYSPKNREIVLCYELMESFAKDFAGHVESEEKLIENVIYTTFFVFFHESGHALVDILELPITGKEEDAVDQLATVILTLAEDDGAEIVIAAAQQFQLASAQQNKLAFWDEHSLDQQRFYNIVCLLYGSNPKKYESLVKRKILPQSRAARCPSEYQKVATSWLTLLAPYMRPEALK